MNLRHHSLIGSNSSNIFFQIELTPDVTLHLYKRACGGQHPPGGSMKKEEEVYTTCDWCGKDVVYGNAMVTINRNIEQMDSTEEYPDGIVTVIQSDSLLELCAQIGNKLDSEMLEGILLAVKR
jgi:hypothetical protein